MDNNLPDLTLENFAKLGPSACAVFAWRTAMRVAPLLGSEKGLDFWHKKEREQHLAAVLAALDVASPKINPQTFTYAAAKAAYAADAAADAAYAAKAAAYTADAAAYAAKAAAYAAKAAAYATYAADATKAAAYATYAAYADTALYIDLQQLLTWRSSVTGEDDPLPPPKIIFAPLWPEGEPDGWAEVVQRWASLLRESGFDSFADAYQDLLEKHVWDVEASLQRFNEWYERYRSKDDSQDSENQAEAANDTPPHERRGRKKGAQPSQNVISLAPTLRPNHDQPALQDALGREALVKALTAVLDDETYPGRMTIGLLGHWGAGKSSVLVMLSDALSKKEGQKDSDRPEHDYVCATFNAWAYEHTDNIQAGLAQEVVNGLTKGMGIRERLDWAERFALSTEPIKYLGILLIFLLIGLYATYLILQDKNVWPAILAAFASFAAFWLKIRTVFSHPLAETFQTYLRLPSFGTHLGALPVIQRQVKVLCDLMLSQTNTGRAQDHKKSSRLFQRIMSKFIYRGRKKRRLLFMVDDLDRCGVAGVVKTLEAVRLVMDLPNVTTIVAIDHRMALAALAAHYHDLAEKGSDRTAHAIARDYLGKIFNLPIQLEKPGETELESFVDKVLFAGVERNTTPLMPHTPATQTSTSEGNVGASDSPAPVDKRPSVSAKIPDGEFDVPTVRQLGAPSVSGDSSNAVIREREKIQEIIRDSQEERNLFLDLSKALRITNPRQLIRLHNSYRLLKALHYHQDGGKTEGDTVEYTRLMTMLFWLEYLADMDKEKRLSEEQALLDDSKHGNNPKPDESTYRLVKNRLGLDSASKEAYESLKKRVEVFMLPHTEIPDKKDQQPQ